MAAADRPESGHFVYPTGVLETSGRCLMIVLLYIFILPSPRVFTSALAVQYPCFPRKHRVTAPWPKGSGSGDINGCIRQLSCIMRQEESNTTRTAGNCNRTKEVRCRRVGADSYHLLRPPPQICAPSLPIGGHKHCIKSLDHEDPTTRRSWQVVKEGSTTGLPFSILGNPSDRKYCK